MAKNEKDFVIEDGVLKEYKGKGGDVAIPEGVVKIIGGAIKDNPNIKTVSIPASVKQISKADGYRFYVSTNNFSNCPNITEYIVDKDNENYSSVDGVLYNKDCTVLISCPIAKAGEITMPDSVVEIGQRSFADCYKVTNVIFSGNLKKIGLNAFKNCVHLTELIIPESVTEITDYAFENCGRLTKVELLNPETKIGYGAFMNCYLLQNSYLVADIVYTHNRKNGPQDTKLKYILNYLEHKDEFDSRCTDRLDEYIKSNKKRTADYILENGSDNAFCTFIEYGYFTVRNIDEYIDRFSKEKNAFRTAALMDYKNKNISSKQVEREESRKINNSFNIYSVENIKKLWKYRKVDDGYEIYKYLGEDKNISIPEMIGRTPVVSVAHYLHCVPKTIEVPRYVNRIEHNLGNLCCYRINVVPENENFCSIDGVVFSKDRKKLLHMPEYYNSSKYVIPDGVTEIGEYACYACASIKTVILPEGVKKIGYDAFCRCKIRTITIPASVTEIDGHAFYLCDNLTIHAPEGSYAEEYAKENKIKFEAIK